MDQIYLRLFGYGQQDFYFVGGLNIKASRSVDTDGENQV